MRNGKKSHRDGFANCNGMKRVVEAVLQIATAQKESPGWFCKLQ